jgi:hypothetical protein
LTHCRSSVTLMLYYYRVDDNNFITHDGYCQLGIFHDLDFFLQNVKIQYTETYWLPDVFSKRYKRINFQTHLKHQSILEREEKF